MELGPSKAQPLLSSVGMSDASRNLIEEVEWQYRPVERHKEVGRKGI